MKNIVLYNEKIENIKAEFEIVLINKDSRISQDLQGIFENTNFFKKTHAIYLSFEERKIYLNIKKKSKEDIKTAFATLITKIKSYKINTLKLDVFQLNKELNIDLIVEGFMLGNYSFNRYKTDKNNKKELLVSIEKSSKNIELLNKKIQNSLLLCQSVNYVRDIVNSAPQDYFPQIMANDALEISKNSVINCTIYGEDFLLKEKMNALHSVGRASVHETKLIHLSYIPKKTKAKIVLVGKGVTYDTGGLSLKRDDGMVSMKCDKAGGSAILGIMRYLSSQNIDIEVHGIIGAVENMIGGNAYKPDDVIKTASNQTVEVTNTDAEGRLVLADCLTYAQKNIKNIDYLFDFATLTGASISAFGGFTTAIMGYSEKYKKDILKASKKSGELVGFLPFNDYLKDKLDSNIADFTNSSSNKNGAAITAAFFLSKFIKKENKKKWLHFDIAGPSYRKQSWGCNPYGATGCMVRLISKYICKLDKKLI